MVLVSVAIAAWPIQQQPQPYSLTYIYLRVAAVHRIILDRPGQQGGDSVQKYLYLRLMVQLGADPGPVDLLGPWGIAPADWQVQGGG